MNKTEHPLFWTWHAKRRYTRVRLEAGHPGVLPEPWYSDFWAFVRDFPPKPDGPPPDGSAFWVMDRVDNDAAYSPAGVQWITQKQHNVKTNTQDVDWTAVMRRHYDDTPGAREKMSAAARRRWAEPGAREKHSADINAMPVLVCGDCGYEGKKGAMAHHRKPRFNAKDGLSVCERRRK